MKFRGWNSEKSDRRALLLLRLGSDRDDAAVARPGFEARLRARIESGAAARQAAAWSEGFETLVRPALALAASLVLVSAGFYLQGSSPPGEADLASLVETDSVFDSLVAGDPGVLLEDPGSTPAPPERP